jgi:hypothetical protein
LKGARKGRRGVFQQAVPFHALELIEDETTVLLPNYKCRGTQGLCDAHRKRCATSRIG